MGERQQYSPEGWLDLATAGIRFKPDRAAVRAELKAHIEDQAEAIRRRHPDLGEEEAERQAAAQMGDPEEVGRALARLHRPWLGWLWRASQVLLGLGATCVLWIVLWRAVHTPWQAVLRSMTSDEETLPQGTSFTCVEPVRIDHYTLWVEEAVLDGSGTLQLVWRITSPLFWETPRGDAQTWTAVDDQGNAYVSRWYARFFIGEERERSVGSVSFRRALPGWTGSQSIYRVPRDARWVEIALETGGGEPVRLMLEREEDAP